jgi:type I restriction enzyme M protein
MREIISYLKSSPVIKEKALRQRLNILDEQELAESFVVNRKKFSLAKLKYTALELEIFSFVDGKNSLSSKDILGDFFEGIIREGFKQIKGQFFAHINIFVKDGLLPLTSTKNQLQMH